MKRSELTFTALLVPVDFLLVLLAAITAYSLRFGVFKEVIPILFNLPFKEYLGIATGVSAVFVLFFALAGLYSVGGPRRLRMEISRIFLACSAAMMTLIVTIFFQRELFSSRFIVITAWFLAFVYVGAGRIAVRYLQRFLLRYGIGARRVFIIGKDDRPTGTLTDAFSGNPAIGYRIAGKTEKFDEAAAKRADLMNRHGEIDEIMVTAPDMGREELSRILGFAESRHLTFKYSADLLATRGKNIEISTVAGVPIVEIKGTRLDGWGKIFKRIFDLVGSAALIIITSPIMLASAIAIAIDSRGPVFWSRLDDGTPVTRVGEHGRPFRYLKFRSMKPNTHNLRYTDLAHLDTRNGPLVKLKEDPRVTRVGKFIRKYSIDELPELFLVFSGKMSLVGPRPHLPEEVARYEDHERKVLTIKPGITGLAQISGRADLTFDEEVKLDTYYMEHWSPWLDLIILAKTPLAVFRKKGAD